MSRCCVTDQIVAGRILHRREMAGKTAREFCCALAGTGAGHPLIMHRIMHATPALVFLFLLLLHAASGKYDRSNDLFDFYAGGARGVRALALVSAVFPPPDGAVFPPPAMRIVYVGDCADILAEDVAGMARAVSFQCMREEEEVDTCRYALQADDRDLDFVRDGSCAIAALRAQPSAPPEPNARALLLVPLHCGCHDVAHPAHVVMELVQRMYQGSGQLPDILFAFNCYDPSFYSKLSVNLDLRLRKLHPHLLDDAAPWTVLGGKCDINMMETGLFDINLQMAPSSNVNGNFTQQSTMHHPNVIAVIFGMHMPHLSPCLSAIKPKLWFSPINGSIIYCDVPFPVKFSWLFHSALRPFDDSHRMNAGILEFRSAYLMNSLHVRLALSAEDAMVSLKCSEIIPSAPLMVTVEATFESFSSEDDSDGGNHNLFYTLATPCSMPPAQIPGDIRAALHDAAVFIWDHTQSIDPPSLNCTIGVMCALRFRAPSELPCRLSCNNHTFYTVAQGSSRVLGKVVGIGACQYELQFTFHVPGFHEVTMIALSAGGSVFDDALELGHFLPITLLGPVSNISVYVEDSKFMLDESYCEGLSCVNGRGIWIRKNIFQVSEGNCVPLVDSANFSKQKHLLMTIPQSLCRNDEFLFIGLEGNSIRDITSEAARKCFTNVTLLLLGNSHERILVYDILSYAFPELWDERKGFVSNFHHLLLHHPVSIGFKGISYNFSYFCNDAPGAARCVPPLHYLEQSRRALSVLLKHAQESSALSARHCVLIAGSVAHLAMIMTTSDSQNAALGYLQLLAQAQATSGCTVLFSTSPPPRSFDLMPDGTSGASSYNERVANRNGGRHGSIRISYERVVALNEFCVSAARQFGIGVVDLNAFSSSSVLNFFDSVHPLCPPGFHSRVYTNQQVGGVTAQTAMIGTLRGLMRCES